MVPLGDSIEAVPAQARPERRRDLDLMRMCVVVGLVFFHSARIFDSGDFYVKNEPTSDLVSAAVSFAATWGMPLLFVIAGMGIWYSLGSRTMTAFSWERVRRLLVPLVFGVLVIVPPQIWTRLRADPEYDESYWQFLPQFFDVELAPGAFPFVVASTPSTGLFEWAHLWFVVLLFAYSVLLLPAIWCLRRPAGVRAVERLADRADRFWVIVAAGLPFAVLDAVFGAEEGLAGWSRYSYAAFLLYGYVLATDRRFGRALRRHRWRALALGVATFTAVGFLFALGSEAEGADVLLDHDAVSLGMRAIKGVSGWLWVVAILGFASRPGTQGRASSEASGGPTAVDRAGSYTSEAVLPFYVLHQTVIVLVAFYVVQWQIGATFKYLIICASSFAVILAIYDVAVRRTAPTRFLFGMKPPRD
jgi:peptidoglycan/LPS O-acetylase OafA/YrhL